MADQLEKLSDEELEAIVQGRPSRPKAAMRISAPDPLEDLSDEQLLTIASGRGSVNPEYKPAPSFGQKALGAVSAVGEFVDKFTGAPSRAALSAGIEGQSPLAAFAKQFGADPKQ